MDELFAGVVASIMEMFQTVILDLISQFIASIFGGIGA